MLVHPKMDFMFMFIHLINERTSHETVHKFVYSLALVHQQNDIGLF